MLKLLLALVFLVGCGDNVNPALDAGADSSIVPTDASVDAKLTPDAEVFPPCAEVCPDEEWFPWMSPEGLYLWSYCLPSYQRCDDPAH